MRAIILAAGRGMRLRQLEEEQLPKCLLRFDGRTLLERHLLLLKNAGVHEVVLALGFRRDLVVAELDRLGWQPRPEIVVNERFELGSVLARGRWIGLLNVSRDGLTRLKAVLARLRDRPDFDALDMPASMNALIADGAQIEVLYVHGHWRGVNDLEDFRRAVDFAHAQTPFGSTPGGTPAIAPNT
jgi:NDP-sugar pyrophosphorylase family protein